MKPLFIILLISCGKLNAQEITIKKTDNPIASAKYYWAYSVRRVGTAHDSLHHYTIWVSVVKRDSGTIYNQKTVTISDPYIYCIVKSPKGSVKNIRCFPNDVYFIGDFSIRTYQKVPVTIVALYNKRKYKMNLVLNKGVYPGENEIEE